jgi:hypothetical protein
LIGEQDDLITSAPFYRFLERGLGAFLSSGRAFVEDGKMKNDVSLLAGTDLIRLLAMAICPNSSYDVPLQSQGEVKPKTEADSLATSTFPYSFYLVYADRARLVQLCAEDMVVPEITDGESSDTMENCSARNNDKKKLFSAIRELRESLFRFASYNAQSEQDVQLAYKALVNIIVREGNPSTIRFEFERLIDVLLKSRSEDGVGALSDCLSDLIARYNGSRYYADGESTRYALVLLVKCINDRVPANDDSDAAQLKQQTDDDDCTTKPQSKECKPYHFIAVLKVSKSLLCFLLDDNTLRRMVGDALNQEALDCAKIEGESRLQLIHDATVMLLYPCLSVVKNAAELLATAFAYDEQYLSEISNIKRIFAYTKKAIESWGSKDSELGVRVIMSLKGLIYTASRRSEVFAFNLLSVCAKAGLPKQFWNAASIISSVQPRIVTRVLTSLESGDINKNSGGGGIHQLLTQLSRTVTQNSKQLSLESIERYLRDDSISRWTMYKLIRQCFVTCNFGLAREILEKDLIKSCTQQTNFLWLTSLIHLARGEEMLRVDGYRAIPSSLADITASHSILSSLANLTSRECQKYQFGCLGRFDCQLKMLIVRAEFLQLVKDVRCTCSDYMLTSDHLSSNTRTRLHLKNLSKCFAMLASSYIKIYRLFGLHHSEQSRSALRGLISMCSFLGEIVDLVFLQKPSVRKTTSASDVNLERDVRSIVPTGDNNHPMGILLSRLRTGITDAKESSNQIGPEVLLATIDTLFDCPLPFPYSFFTLKPIPKIYSTIIQTSGQEVIDVAPGTPFKLMVIGILPETVMTSGKIEFHQVIAWPSVCFEGHLVDDDELYDPNETKSNNGDDRPMNIKSKLDVVATALLPGGKFIMPIEFEPIVEEGYHKVEIQIGCRDIFCNEWHLPTQNEMNAVVRVVDR